MDVSTSVSLCLWQWGEWFCGPVERSNTERSTATGCFVGRQGEP